MTTSRILGTVADGKQIGFKAGGVTSVVGAFDGVPTPIVQSVQNPFISGNQRVGQVSTANAGGLTGVSSYQWKLDGVDISGATSSTYTTVAVGALTCTLVSNEGTFNTAANYIREEGLDEQDGHDAAINLIPTSDVTHTTIVSSGDFNEAGTWDRGTVPSAGDVWRISHGHTITYDVTSSPRFDRGRIDGHLVIDTTLSTECLIDTVYVSLMGSFKIATRSVPLPEGTTSTWTFSNRFYNTSSVAPTNLDFTGTDPMLMGRGLLAHGEVRTYGAVKTAHAKVLAGTHPLTDDTTLTLATAPTNWQIGDEIAVTGVHPDINSATNSVISSTEYVTITNVSGSVVTFTPALAFDHKNANTDASFPSADDDALTCSIANLSRNIVFQTEDPETTAVHQRAHFMVMQKDAQARLFHTKFYEMGRTDKSQKTGEIRNMTEFWRPTGENSMGFITATDDSNISGRYSVHLHRNGFGRASDQRPIVYGCVADGSPGWAMVHHDCDSDWDNNVICRFHGAGLVAEQASELGSWDNNLSFGTTNTSTNFNHIKVSEDNSGGKVGDVARWGYSFFFRGRSVRATRNIAADCPHGFVFYHRHNLGDSDTFSRPIDMDRTYYDVSDVNPLHDKDVLSYVDAPILHFADNEAYGVFYGLEITKSFSGQNHDLNINLKRFKCWNSIKSADIEYIGSYVLSDFECYYYGSNTSLSGETIHSATSDTAVLLVLVEQVAIINLKSVGFYHGIDLTSSGLLNRESDGNALTSDDFDLNDWRFAVVAHNNIAGRSGAITYTTSVDGNTGLAPTNTAQDVTAVLTSMPTETGVSTDVPQITHSWDGTGGRFGVSGTNRGGQRYKRDSYTESAVGAGNGVVSGGTAATFASNEPGIALLPKVWDTAGFARQDNSGQYLQSVLDTEGYWQYDSKNVIRLPIYFSDRLYATPHKYYILCELEATVSLTGKTDNGAYTVSANPPVAADLSVAVTAETATTFNALSGVTDADGDTVTLERSIYSPDYGRIEIDNLATGSLIYYPNLDHPGTDSMIVWVSDTKGHVTNRVVNFTVS